MRITRPKMPIWASAWSGTLAQRSACKPRRTETMIHFNWMHSNLVAFLFNNSTYCSLNLVDGACFLQWQIIIILLHIDTLDYNFTRVLCEVHTQKAWMFWLGIQPTERKLDASPRKTEISLGQLLSSVSRTLSLTFWFIVILGFVSTRIKFIQWSQC